MKPKNINLGFIIMIITLSYGCEIFDNESLPPGISIYKPKGDYFDLVDIGMMGDKIYRTNSYWNERYESFNYMEIRGDDTVYTCRYKLPDGYILDSDANEQNDVFLNITFKEQLYRELSGNHPGAAMPHDTIRKYILDKDPYIEFYRNRTNVKLFSISDSLEIKEILLKGEIDKYFKKIK